MQQGGPLSREGARKPGPPPQPCPATGWPVPGLWATSWRATAEGTPGDRDETRRSRGASPDAGAESGQHQSHRKAAGEGPTARQGKGRAGKRDSLRETCQQPHFTRGSVEALLRQSQRGAGMQSELKAGPSRKMINARGKH